MDSSINSSVIKGFKLEYGDRLLRDFLPKYERIKILKKSRLKPQFDDLEKRLKQILDTPLGMDLSFSEFVCRHHDSDKDVIIVIDDYTRPNRHTRILLPLIEHELRKLGVDKNKIKLLIATGTHRPPTKEEIKNKILKKLYEHWKGRILIHDSENSLMNKNIGYSSIRGTPLVLNRYAVGASFLIALGDPEYHYFAGIAGNSKLIVPGIAGGKTIRKNHPLIFDYGVGFRPECRLGNIIDNPMILDVMELVDYIQKNIVPIFSIQAVEQGDRIIWIEGGDIIAVHRESAKILKKTREIHVNEPADLVIVGTGNLGINLFQAGKAVHAGWNAVKRDGTGIIVIIAPVTDGVGNERYEMIMRDVVGMPILEALNYIIRHYCSQDTFVMGNHKPVDQLRVLKDVKAIYFLTEYEADELERIYRFKKIPVRDDDPDLSLRLFLEDFIKEKQDPLIYVLPDPNSLVVVDV